MTITLELPSEVEENIVAQAEARGLSIDAFLQTIIANQAAALELLRSAEALRREGEDPDRLIDELFDAVQVPAGVGQGAMRRENWYR